MTMNTVRGSHLLVTVQNMPSALRGEAARDAGLKVRPPCRWECSDPPLTCERKAEDITMPGSPQGRGQTDKPTRNITFKGKERSKAEGNRESQRTGSVPLFSISWRLSALQSQDFSGWFSFILLFFSPESSDTVPRIVHGFSS